MVRLLLILLADVILVAWGISASADVIFIILMVVWVHYMAYSGYKLESRVLMFAFGISFFVFLLGREFLEQYQLYEPDDTFKASTNECVYLCMILSLLSIWAMYSYMLCRFRPKHNIQRDLLIADSSFNVNKVRHFSLIAFYATYPFSIIYNVVIAIFVARSGYHSYYIDFSSVLAGSSLLYLISKLELVMESAFYIFLASLPNKKQFKKPALFYVFYLVMSLGSGQRSTFLLGLMLLFIFFVFMNGLQPFDGWFKRKYIFYSVVAFPIVAVGASLFNAWRFDVAISEINFWRSFGNFFYEQGVTSYVIKRAYDLEASIPPNIYTLEFIHSGLLAQLFGFDVYHGNTVEHAVQGGSFTHALGYTVMDKAYLAGGGTGSSYIAELFYDFGYVGVILGSMLYGWIFSKINNVQNGSIFKRAVVFICITKLLWAIRASFTGFLSYMFAPTTIVLLLFVFLSSKKHSVGRLRPNKL